MTSPLSKDWKELRLSDLGSCIRGVSYNPDVDLRERDSNDAVRLLRSTNVQDGSLNLKSLQFVSTKRVSTRQNMTSGDVLICMANGSKQLVGKTARFEFQGAHRYTFGAFMGIFRPFDKTDSDFIYFLMQSKAYRNYLDVALSGSSINNLRPSNILEMTFLVPEGDERRKISNALADVDLLVRHLDSLIAKKRDIKQGAMQQLLTGKTRLPGFNGEWKSFYTADVLTKVPNLPMGIQATDYQRVGEIPIVDQGKDLISGFTFDVGKKVSKPKAGYIIFGDHTRIIKFVDFDCAFGADGTQVLEAKVGNHARFVSYALSAQHIPNTGYNRHFKYFNDLLLQLPDIDEQSAIAEVLSDMDAEIEALVARREKTALIKIGMMQELLTGRTRLL